MCTGQGGAACRAQVFELGGDVVPDDMAHGVMRLIAEGAGQEDGVGARELHAHAVASYLRLLSKPSLPDVLLKVTRHPPLPGTCSSCPPAHLLLHPDKMLEAFSCSTAEAARKELSLAGH